MVGALRAKGGIGRSPGTTSLVGVVVSPRSRLGVLAAVGIAVALPVAGTLAANSPCSTTSGAGKCVAITAVSTESLAAGGQTAVTYTFQPYAGAPQVLGSLELSPSDGSGITFAGVSSSVAAANCSISAAGAAVCLDLDASPGQSFTVTIDVDATCSAAGDNLASC